MSVLSLKCSPKIYAAIISAISLPVSGCGAMPLERLDGQMILPCGPEAVPARVSVRAGSGEALAISVTYGLHGSGSLQSAALTQSLASRLRRKTDLLGSTLYRLTWKERVTPSGRRIPALRASARRTSGSDCTSWGTPRGTQHCGEPGMMAKLAAWPTPQVHDDKLRGNTEADHHHRPHDLSNMASWATPQSRDEKGVDQKMCKGEANNSLPNQVASFVASGETPNGSPAATGSSGQLNPAHSRWLMGLLPAWDACAVTVTRSVRRKLSHSSKPT